MNKYEIVRKIEEFAPLMSQEKWDCSGWIVNTSFSSFVGNSNGDGLESQEVKKILFA